MAVQAFAYQLRSTVVQTEEPIPSFLNEEQRDSPFQMPVKKLIKKKAAKKKKSLVRDESQGSMKRAENKSN